MVRRSKSYARWGRGLVVCGLLGLVACAQTAEWRHPTLPSDRWARDEADCRRRAAAEVEEDVARDQAVFGDPSLDRSSTYRTQMARFDAIKARRTLTARCMAARGYVKE